MTHDSTFLVPHSANHLIPLPIIISSILQNTMKNNQRRKTFGFERSGTVGVKPTRKHNSTFSVIREEAGRMVVLDIIQHLLGRVDEEEKQRTKFIAFMMKKLEAMEAEDAIYFRQQQGDEENILCRQDDEPPAQENRSLQVVKKPKHLKKTSKMKFGEQSLDQSQLVELSRIDPDKKDRDIIIQKLKREYSMILQSKYLSQSSPIAESRSFFMEGDTPDIAYMRSNFGKTNTKKGKKHKPSFVQQQIRNNRRLDTIFKKSRDYVQTIDPTMSNSIYLNQVQPQTSSHRASVVNPPLLPQQPAAIVKVSKLKEVTNVMSTKNEVVSQKNIAADARDRNTKITNLVVEQQRQSLKLRVERSFHSNTKMQFREVIETQRKPRQKNTISVSFLPRLSRN